MTAKRIMLFGAAGQLGQALRAETWPDSWRLGAYGRAECDVTDHRAVQNAIQIFKPDLVINAAAMVAVDQCETEPEQAMAVNFNAPANLAAQCASIDAPLIHISTDYVFDGKDGARPYRSDDMMNPLNVYGQSKMMGEEAIRHEHAWHVILRTSSMFSAFGSNLLTRTLKMIDERDTIQSVTDQIACPTYAPDVAKAITTIARALLGGQFDVFGTFHLCGAPPAARLEFTQAVMEAYAPYTSRRPKIVPALSSDSPPLAERPAYSALDCEKIRTVYGIEQKPWQDGLAEAVKALKSRAD